MKIMENKKIIEKYNNWNDSLEKKFCQLHDERDYYIWDGVVSPIQYFNSKIKILFLNREAYDVEGDSFDLVKTIDDQIKNNKPFWVKQRLLKSSLKKEFVAIKAIMEKDNRKLEELLDSYTKNDFIADVQTCAFINIKKSDGEKHSSVKNLRQHAEKNLEIIKEQIRYFNPSIIVGGNVVDGILEETELEWGENLYSPNAVNVFQVKIDDNIYPYLDLYHPSSTKINAKDIFDAMKKVEKKCPKYWQERLNPNCFDIK